MKVGFNTYLKALTDCNLVAPAIKVAIVVGTILFIINHANALFYGTMTTQRWVSAFLSYIVPYLVSIHGRVSSENKRNNGAGRSGSITSI